MMGAGLRIPSRTRGSGFGIDIYRAIYQAIPVERIEPEEGGSGEATRIGYSPGSFYFLPVDLTQSVDELLLQLRGLHLQSIIFIEDRRIRYPEIPAQVYDQADMIQPG